jgi:hypothetical protein
VSGFRRLASGRLGMYEDRRSIEAVTGPRPSVSGKEDERSRFRLAKDGEDTLGGIVLW